MKTSKRILSALLAVVFTLVSFVAVPVFAEDAEAMTEAETSSLFSDVVAGSDVEEAVTVLNKLSVINGYNDGTFKPNNNVTRAEFTAMLLRTRGMGTLGSTSLENPPFPDVVDPSVSWAIGNIRTARDLKIVNGYDDGTFKPNNTVKYEEAVKMIVCALGYGEMGTEGAAWYTKYLQSAIQLKFVDGVGGQIGVPATRAVIALMLYNCLEVKLAENNEVTDKTILESDLKLTKRTGYVTATPEISLSSPDPNLRADEIKITATDENNVTETLTYKVDNVDEYADMLGARVTFYFKSDRNTGFKTLVMANLEKSVTVEVDAANIDASESDDSTLVYYKSADAKTSTKLKISDDSIVVYNGQLYGMTAEESTYEIFCDDMGEKAIPTLGSIKLLDKDGDKSYDIIFVDSYEAYIASSVTSSTYTVVDNNLRKGLTPNKVILDPTDVNETVKFVDASGNASSFSAIKTGSVVCVKKSNVENGGQPITTAVICNNTVSGTVKAVNSDDTIKIDSREYSYSKQAPWVNPMTDDLGNTATVVMTEPGMGDAGKFYLDLNGDIIGFDKTEVASNQQYGYIMTAKISTEEVFDETVILNIMNQSGTKKAFVCYDKTKINGSDFDSSEELLEALAETALPSDKVLETDEDETVYPLTGAEEGEEDEYAEKFFEKSAYAQLVKFSTKTVKGETVIDEIITMEAVEGGATVETDELHFLEEATVADSYTYDSTTKTLTCEDGAGKIYISSAIVMSIPEIRSETKEYKKMSLSGLVDEQNYKVEFYDVSTSKSAKVVLVYGGASSAGEVNANSPVFFVTEKEYTLDPNDSSVYRYHLTGFVGSTEADYWFSTETATENVLEDVEEGAVIRLGTDNDGYYTVKDEHVIFNVDGSARTGSYPKSESISNTVRYRIYWGSAVEYVEEDDRFVLAIGDLLTGDEAPEDIDEDDKTSIYLSNCKSAKIITIQLDEDGEISEMNTEIPASDNESIIAEMTFTGTGAADEVFIHQSSSTAVKLMVIVKR